MTSITSRPASARYDTHHDAVVITSLSISDPVVVSESRRWVTGRRGPVVAPADMGDADLAAFVTQAITIGVHAIAGAGGVQDQIRLDSLVAQVGDRTAEASSKAAAVTADAVTAASSAMERVSTEARKAITDAGIAARQSFSDNVESARKALADEVVRLLGGENPELLARLGPVLDRFGRDLDDRATKQTADLIERVTRQFDPADPTSPIAKHNAELTRQQQELSQSLDKNHRELEAKVEELTAAVRRAHATAEAATATARLTTLKGGTFEQRIHELMDGIAAGLGDEYAATGTRPGAVSRSKKGDGVLSVDGGAVNVVIEMTDSKRTSWNSYLDEAERNRTALASLGLVRSPDQLGGRTVQTITARRIVMAFDPELDDPAMLRTVVQMLRLAAVAANARRDDAEIDTAREKLTEAIDLLGRIDEVKRLAGLVGGNATKIDKEADGLRSGLDRLLGQAMTALTGAAGSESAAA